MAESTGWHELKTWPEPFGAVEAGSKTFECRSTERNYLPGDMVTLREWDPETRSYTGRQLDAEVGYVLHSPAFGVPEGFVVFALLHVGDVESSPKRSAG